MSPRRGKTPTPADELAELHGRRVAVATERAEWGDRRTVAERRLAELPDARRAAITAKALGEPVELPDPVEEQRLRQTVVEAGEHDEALRVAERTLDEQQHEIIDPNVSWFDDQAEQAARDAEQALELAVNAARDAQSAIRQAVEAFHVTRRARLRIGSDAQPEGAAADFGGVLMELARARGLIWPGGRERVWRTFRGRETRPGRPTAATVPEIREQIVEQI